MAQALIYKTSATRPLGKVVRCWPYFFYSRGCVLLAYIWFFGLSLMALTVLIVFGVGTVQPYIFSLQFRKTQCETLNSSYRTDVDGATIATRCSCGKHCRSSWPCLIVSITYSPPGNGVINTSLYDSQYELTKDGEVGPYTE